MKNRFFIILLSIILTMFLISCKNNEIVNTSNNSPSTTYNTATEKNESDTDKKSNVTSNTSEKSSNSSEKSSFKNIKCRLYFFNMSELKHYYIDKTIPVENGALVTALTKELQNTSYNKDFLPLTDKAKIKSAKLEETTGVLKIVFSDSYVNHMNLGSATESGLLSSLLATYGYNLGVNKIAIYFNNELYTCLGDLQKGYFTVEYPSAKMYTP